MKARWRDQIYRECMADFRHTGYRGIGVRLLNDRGNWVTNVDIDLQDWIAAETEQGRMALIDRRLDETLSPSPVTEERSK